MSETVFTVPSSTLAPAPATPDGVGTGTFEFNTEHAAQMVNQLIEFFRKPRNSEMMRVIGAHIQDIEDVIQQLYLAFDVDTAVGDQLDKMGEIVGERRDDRTDDEYRPAIRTRILVNLSNGKYEELIDIILSYSPTATIVGREVYPAGLHFDIVVGLEESLVSLGRLLRQAKAAGVRLDAVQVDADTMIWNSTPGPDPNGWGANWALLV